MQNTDDHSFTFEREDDWSSCAYFYLHRPENGLPDLMPMQARVEGLVAEGALN